MVDSRTLEGFVGTGALLLELFSKGTQFLHRMEGNVPLILKKYRKFLKPPDLCPAVAVVCLGGLDVAVSIVELTQ